MKSHARFTRVAVCGFWLAACALARLPAQVVWTGGGADDYWSTHANWQGGVAPATDGTATIQFAGSTRLTPYLDTYTTSVQGLEFASGAGAFTVGGFGGFTIGSGGLTQGSSTAQTINANVTVGAPQTWSLAGNLTVNGYLSGSSNLTLTSTSFLTSRLYLNAANSYSGTLKISSGSVTVGHTNSLASATVSLDGGTLNYDSSLSQVSLGGIAGSGQLFFQNQNGSVTVSIGGNNQNSLYTGTLAQTSGDGDLKWVGSGTLYLTGSVSKIFRVASGTVSIAGNSGTFTSPFVVIDQFATLDYSRDSFVTFDGSTSGAGAMTITRGMAITGTLGHTGGTTVSADVHIGLLASGGNSGGVTGNIDVTSSGSLTFERNTALSYSGNISGGGYVTKNGTGTLTLSGNNTFSGGLGIVGGTVSVSSNSNLGSTSGTLTFSGGTLETLADITSSRAITLSSGGGTFSVGSGTTLTLSGAIGGSSGTLTKTGGGTLVLGGANTHTGGTTISAGTLQLGAANRIASSSAMTLGGGTFATAGFSQSLGTLTLNSNSTLDFGSGTSALAFADSSALGWAGTLTISNYTSGTDTLRFGTSSSGLTPTQLSAINFGGGLTAQIDANGYVTGVSAIPEPSSYAACAALAMLALASRRHFRKATIVEGGNTEASAHS